MKRHGEENTRAWEAGGARGCWLVEQGDGEKLVGQGRETLKGGGAWRERGRMERLGVWRLVGQG